MKKQIKPLPFAFYFYPVVFLAVLGLLDSIYLSLSHFRVYTDIGYKSFCAISKSINCDTVSQSPYSIFWGLPVPVWGVFGYTFYILLLTFARHPDAGKKRIWSILLVTSLLFSLFSVALALISTFYIKSHCIMCIASYAVNLLLLFYTWIIRRRFDEQSLYAALKTDLQYIWAQRRKAAAFFGPLLLGVLVIFCFFPEYWRMSFPSLVNEAPHGITSDGHPWIGSENPEWTIEEFTDYECFQCRKMHYFLRQIISQRPDKLRIVHRHFPMDHKFNPAVKEPYHEAAGYMSLLAIYSQDNGKFWEMNDLLFNLAGKKKDIEISRLGEKTGVPISGLKGALIDPELRARLNKDIRDGIRLGVHGTPGFVINGKVYLSEIPSKILNEILD